MQFARSSHRTIPQSPRNMHHGVPWRTHDNGPKLTFQMKYTDIKTSLESSRKEIKTSLKKYQVHVYIHVYIHGYIYISRHIHEHIYIYTYKCTSMYRHI